MRKLVKIIKGNNTVVNINMNFWYRYKKNYINYCFLHAISFASDENDHF